MKATNTTPDQSLSPVHMHRHEILGILSFTVTLLLACSIYSYDLRTNENWVGVLGNSLAGLLVSAFGLTAYAIPLELFLGTIFLFRRQVAGAWIIRFSSILVILIIGCAFLHISLGDMVVFGGHLPGGALGELLGEVMRSLIGLAGAYIVCISLLLVTILLRIPVSLSVIIHRVSLSFFKGIRSCKNIATTVWKTWRQAETIEEEGPFSKLTNSSGMANDSSDSSSDQSVGLDTAIVEEKGGTTSKSPIAQSRLPSKSSLDPIIVAPQKHRQPSSLEGKPIEGKSTLHSTNTYQPFVLPPSKLLSDHGESTIPIDEVTLKENAIQLVDKLEAYGVKGRVDEIHPGPVVTMYEFEPASGTKVSKIAGLSDDLAMALAAQKVRIVAPIPGKARVGFELPNDVRQTVFLRELLEEERWQKYDCALPVIFGKNIAGQPEHGDLSKMPHLLVAGATGSGKSVGLSVMLISLLLKKTPDEVRLLMIDPKVVELAAFDGIPHMLLPVVTDMKKAALALRWAVDEMERRYQLFADAGARNIVSYNERVDKVLRGEISLASLSSKRKVRSDCGRHLSDAVEPPNQSQNKTPVSEEANPDRLPHIVLVVDEFADLMMVAAKDVEAAVARLAQKARAAGIHVVLATQRPSVDVITGMIKANFPCRVAYKVAQREDSKTILGRIGAEHLLGNGDMLMLLPGASDPKRVHSAFIKESEVTAVCDFLRAQGAPIYDDEILKPRESDEADPFSSMSSSEDSLYDRAVAIVAEAGYCSISHIQRRLSIGYNKAATIVERMEKEGVVGAPSGKAGGRREVLIQSL